MENKYVQLELKDEAIAILTINRPEKRNALNLKLMDELFSGIEKLQQTPCRAVIIAANGTTFSSGLDLKEAADPSLNEASASHVAKMLTTIVNTPLVTIAAVQGDAFAGGAGLVAACDLAVMSKAAAIGFPEVRRGLVAAMVSTCLVQQISTKSMRELLLTGEPVDAVRAQSMGLVNRIAANGDVLKEALLLAEQVIKGGPEAIRLTKQLISKLTAGNFSNEMQHALALHHAVRNSDEAREGIAAFLEKRS